jgi:DNA polymerase V
LEEVLPHPQNIIVSRGFKTRVKAEGEMIEAVSFYANRAAEKARGKKVYATNIHVFIRTDPYGDKQNSYSAQRIVKLHEAQNDAPTIIHAALQGLEAIYKPNLAYQKAGIMLTGLLYEEERQTSFFGGGQSDKASEIMKVMDKINKIHGRETLRPAIAGSNKTWFMARNLLSPRYTTKWNELKSVYC